YAQLATNWLSDLSNTLEMQAFSQACLTSTSEPKEVGVGSSVVLHLHPERKNGDELQGAEKFEYVSPDAAPIRSLLDSFAMLLTLAQEAMSLRPEGEVTNSGESGISRAWRWHSAEKRLVTMPPTNKRRPAASWISPPYGAARSSSRARSRMARAST